MGEKDDGLGLSLSLGCGGPTTTTTQTHTHSATTQPSGGGGGGGGGSFLKLNLMQKPPPPPPSPSSSSMQYHHHLHPLPKTTSPWNEIFHLSSDRNSDARSFLRGLDVNRTPPSAAAADYYEEENGVSSPNSTVSSISGKRSEREAALGGEEAEEGDRDSCSRGGGGSDDDDGGNGGGDASRKKLRLTKDQSLVLEETFKEHNTLNPKQKLALAKQLNLRPRQVEVWFQNRRARTKLKQTEVDCEYLKRCCENLTEENRRLQKEVQELRALKLSPQLYMHMSPPTTLTMCPSCERVAVSSTSSSTSTTAAPNGPNRQPSALGPSIPRPVPINPWAALPIQHRRCDAPASRS